MFSKDSRKAAQSDHDTREAPTFERVPPAERAPPAKRSGVLPRTTATAGIPSIISEDLSIVGELKSKGDLQVDGIVEGTVSSRVVTVGAPGVVRGAVVAHEARIHGTVEGEIEADSVLLAKTARVDGDVLHGSLSIEAGASISGKVSRLERASDVRNAASVAPKTSRMSPVRDSFWEEDAKPREIASGIFRAKP